jgi:hypothetical protein
MTAEIAIMNKCGIALAADSKVSIGGGSSLKSFDTVNKLFTLSKAHPIGIMVWGNAEFMQHPWEVIIKQFRHEKRGKSEHTVDKWANDFVAYLRSFRKFTNEECGKNIYTILDSLFDEIKLTVASTARRRGIIVPSTEYVDLLIRYIDFRIIDSRKKDLSLTKLQAEKLAKQYGGYISTAIKEGFSDLGSAPLIEKIQELAIVSLVYNVFSPQSSGFVIAGYGEDEIFPSLIEFETDGYLGPNLKLNREEPARVLVDTRP